MGDWLKRKQEKAACNNIINELPLTDLPYYRKYLDKSP